MTPERDIRLDVAIATRVLAVAGLFDMHGHISIREGDAIYICDRGASRLTLRPELVASVRVSDGARLSDKALPPSETALHLAAYRAKPDVRSVAHFHPLYATAFAVAGKAANLGRVKPYTKDEIRRVAEMLTSPFVIEKTWVYALEKARVAGALSDLDQVVLG